MESHYHYESLSRFVDVLDAPSIVQTEKHIKAYEQFKNQTGPFEGISNKWSGWDQTAKFWREGWPEGIEKAHRALGLLERPMIKDRRRRPKWTTEGDQFDRDRMLAGHYDSAWLQVRRETRAAPVPVRITVDVEAHAWVAAKNLFWRGAGAVMLAESLGAVGYPVCLVATSGAAGMRMQSGDYRQYISIVIKQWDMPIYLPSLISTVGHGSFLRVGVFSHNLKFMPTEYADGLGHSLNTGTAMALKSLGFVEPNIRNVIMPAITSQEEAVRWSREIIEELESPNAARQN